MNTRRQMTPKEIKETMEANETSYLTDYTIEIENPQNTKIPHKTKKPSKSYTIKSFAENIKKINDFGYLTKDEFVKLRETNLEIVRKYIEHEFNNK